MEHKIESKVFYQPDGETIYCIEQYDFETGDLTSTTFYQPDGETIFQVITYFGEV